MDERRVQCEFFIPIVRNSDKKPHQPIAWNLLVNEIRRLFPAGHSGPETFYRGDALVPGEYEESPGRPSVSDTSRCYLLAIPEGKVNDLRLLLKMAAHAFDQQAIYLSVAGTVEFVIPTEEDGYLETETGSLKKGGTKMAKKTPLVYRTITGRCIPVSKLSRSEKEFLSRVQQKYHGRLEWTRFAAWWNAELTRTSLNTRSPVYRICQDLEARLGIQQGSLSPPDYRDFLADLIDGQFGSRQEFCQATGVDPGQLSRVFAGRADLSLRALQRVLDVLQAQLVIQTQEQAREQTSVARAEEALALATH